MRLSERRQRRCKKHLEKQNTGLKILLSSEQEGRTFGQAFTSALSGNGSEAIILYKRLFIFYVVSMVTEQMPIHKDNITSKKVNSPWTQVKNLLSKDAGMFIPLLRKKSWPFSHQQQQRWTTTLGPWSQSTQAYSDCSSFICSYCTFLLAVFHISMETRLPWVWTHLWTYVTILQLTGPSSAQPPKKWRLCTYACTCVCVSVSDIIAPH